MFSGVAHEASYAQMFQAIRAVDKDTLLAWLTSFGRPMTCAQMHLPICMAQEFKLDITPNLC